MVSGVGLLQKRNKNVNVGVRRREPSGAEHIPAVFEAVVNTFRNT